ncbi:hypothetical protein [Solidesulfovibrio sp. C21]|uniref:hypothetical protein n=1 Tax=Solidesulfovibrio sp. C21 TaxID=3398613 RepID=UPI0039FD7DDF
MSATVAASRGKAWPSWMSFQKRRKSAASPAMPATYRLRPALFQPRTATTSASRQSRSGACHQRLTAPANPAGAGRKMAKAAQAPAPRAAEPARARVTPGSASLPPARQAVRPRPPASPAMTKSGGSTGLVHKARPTQAMISLVA